MLVVFNTLPKFNVLFGLVGTVVGARAATAAAEVTSEVQWLLTGDGGY